MATQLARFVASSINHNKLKGPQIT